MFRMGRGELREAYGMAIWEGAHRRRLVKLINYNKVEWLGFVG